MRNGIFVLRPWFCAAIVGAGEDDTVGGDLRRLEELAVDAGPSPDGAMHGGADTA